MIKMDELAKTEMRNYLMAGGFFTIATLFISVLFHCVALYNKLEFKYGYLMLISALVLILIGIILIVLNKRDLSAITFMMMGMLYLFVTLDSATKLAFFEHAVPYLRIVTGLAFLILALIILTAKDKKKYLLAIIPILICLRDVVCTVITIPRAVMVIDVIVAVIAIYFAFACASERIRLPFSETLKADVATDFKASGSVLGYLLFAVSTAGYAVYYLTNGGVAHESVVTLDLVCGFMLILSGILLFAIAKMRFTPVMFILLGFLLMITTQVSGLIMYGIGIMVIVLGLFAVLRKESRILPGLMLIIYGLTYFFSGFFSGAVGLSAVQGILNLIPCLIAAYLAFAVFSQSKKLKLL